MSGNQSETPRLFRELEAQRVYRPKGGPRVWRGVLLWLVLFALIYAMPFFSYRYSLQRLLVRFLPYYLVMCLPALLPLAYLLRLFYKEKRLPVRTVEMEVQGTNLSRLEVLNYKQVGRYAGRDSKVIFLSVLLCNLFIAILAMLPL